MVSTSGNECCLPSFLTCMLLPLNYYHEPVGPHAAGGLRQDMTVNDTHVCFVHIPTTTSMRSVAVSLKPSATPISLLTYDTPPVTSGTRPATTGIRQATSGMRQSTPSIRQGTSVARPATLGTRPVTSGIGLTISGIKQATSAILQATPSTRPAASVARPATLGTQPLTSDTRPATSVTRPATLGTRSVTSGTRTAESGMRQATPSTRPATSGTRPATPSPDTVFTGASGMGQPPKASGLPEAPAALAAVSDVAWAVPLAVVLVLVAIGVGVFIYKYKGSSTKFTKATDENADDGRVLQHNLKEAIERGTSIEPALDEYEKYIEKHPGLADVDDNLIQNAKEKIKSLQLEDAMSSSVEDTEISMEYVESSNAENRAETPGTNELAKSLISTE